MVKAPVASSQAIVKVRTSGTLPAGATIGGIKATVTYPTAKGLSITENNVVASDNGTGSLLAANVVSTPGQVLLALISSKGIQAGEFATLTFNIASDKMPLASDFGVASGASVFDTNATALSGISVEIQGVTLQ